MPTYAQKTTERQKLDQQWREAHARLAEVQRDAASDPNRSHLETSKLLDHSRGLQKQIAGLRRQFSRAGFEPPKVG